MKSPVPRPNTQDVRAEPVEAQTYRRPFALRQGSGRTGKGAISVFLFRHSCASFAVVALIGLCNLSWPADAAERPLSAEAARGKAIYKERCVHCHQKQFWAGQRIRDRMGEDYVPLDQRTDLNAAYIHQALRRGVGSMIPYRKTELSDAEIDALAAYLTRPQSAR